MEIAAITGSTGSIGPVMIEHLLRAGYHVKALVRREPIFWRFRGPVQTVMGDICDVAALRSLTEGASVVFHLAANLHANRMTDALRTEYYRVNVEGTRMLTEFVYKAGVRRFIFFSTISVYGPSRDSEIFDEESPLNPDSLYAESKCRAEEIVKEGPAAVILRLAAVYGPHMKGNYARLVKALGRGFFVPVGPGNNRRTLVYEQDVADAALLVAEHPAGACKIYNVTDGNVHTFNEILNAICEALDKHSPRYRFPAAPVRLLAGILEDGFHLFGKRSPIGRATIEKLIEDVAISGERIQKELGFKPQFNLMKGWQNVIDGLRHRDIVKE
jgi:nucleoside-diphosphate-sugar epimerase